MVKIFQKIGYGFVFTILIPSLLILWCIKLNEYYHFPLLHWEIFGILLSIAGGIIMVWSMVSLVIFGKGLPMNAFPPEKLVTQGIYGIIKHPIYTGFTLLSFGISFYTNSPAGYWIVSPLVFLGCVAIVWGYEKKAIQKHFGISRLRTYIEVPENTDSTRQIKDIVSTIVLLGIPWVIIYEAGLLWGNYWGGYDISLPIERSFPVIEWSTVFYSLTYVFVCCVPLLPISKSKSREFIISGIIGTVIGGIMLFTIPIIAPLREFNSTGFWGDILDMERQFDGKGAAFPSFHVIWVIIALSFYIQRYKKLKFVFTIFACAIILSCFTTGMHSLGDITAGIIVGIVSARYKFVWETITGLAERIANSWKEWHIGTIRIINHGFYAGIATMTGVLTVGILAGENALLGITIVTLCSVAGAALWAQIVEGSDILLRPFGYYGAILGGIIGCIVCELFLSTGWNIAAAYSVVAPLIQSIGRLRCLVQGCCHGDKTSDIRGIRVYQRKSRVCKIAHLYNVNIYPTQVYSIIGNILILPILIRLWFADISPSCIIGTYLILSGLFRFVEEHYRGEPQTVYRGGLRIYQWAAIISVCTGIILMCTVIPNKVQSVEFSVSILVHSILWGIIGFAALGVDFPKSSIRFSRLT